MARTTDEAVQALLQYDSSISVTPFIEAATVVVDRVSSCASSKGEALTSTELELIERWLAAHYYTVRDQRYKSKSTEKASATFETINYLDTAMAIDRSGCLSGISKQKTVGLFWLGKAPSEQTDYVDRD